MARIFTEGFEMGDLLGWDNYYSGDGGVSSAYKRSGEYGLGLWEGLSGEGWTDKIIPDKDEIYVRFAFRRNSSIGYFRQYFFDGEAEICSVRSSTSNIYAYVNEEEVLSAYYPFINDMWNLFEIYYKIDVTGKIVVKVNGFVILIYEGNTAVAGSTGNTLRFYAHGANDNNWSAFDDIAVNDTTGSEDNSWCGDGYILRMAPNANGDSSMLVGNDGDSTDNYALVDEVPADDDTTFVFGENVNDYDLYNFADSGLPAEQIIKRVWVEGTAKDPDNGDVSMLIKSGSTVVEDDSDQALMPFYGRIKSDCYTTDPNTGEAWTEDALNAIQAGMKVKS